MKQISKRTFGFLFVGCMAFVMALCMSFIMLWLNRGFSPGFFLIWMKSFVVAFFVAFGIASFAVPMIQKMLAKYFKIKE